MIDGTYAISAKTPMGHIEAEVTYKTKGSVLTGNASAFDTTVDIENGKCNGDAYEHTMRIKTESGAVNLKVKGKVTGDDISGTLKMSLVTARFSGKRIHAKK